MRLKLTLLAVSALLCASALAFDRDWKPSKHTKPHHTPRHADSVQLGPRPFFLVDNMDDSQLKDALEQCKDGPFYKTDFSIGHRGAALQFPEHTKESYIAGARMGAGIVECDVTFTKDRELVCRHSQCDLHTTTNILLTPLAEKCSVPFSPYGTEVDENGEPLPASAMCCTSDITLDEFKSLKGKMDASNPLATTVEEYVGGTADWRTDLYAGTDKLNSLGTLMSHKESIALFQELDVKMTPELKTPSVEMPYDGEYTQQEYAQQMIDEYKEAGVSPRDVYAQSFNLEDVVYWIQNEPRFGKQAVYLDDSYETMEAEAFEELMGSRRALRSYMQEISNSGVRIIAPPMWMLLTTTDDGEIVPSLYARMAKRTGLKIITWTLERSNLTDGGGDWYHQTSVGAVEKPGDKFKVLDALAKKVGVIGVFSDWPATVTYYASCKGLR